jgi:putative transposase
MIQELWQQFPVRVLCQTVELSPSTYYYQPRDNDDLALLSWIEDVLLRFPTYGRPRLTEQLRREGYWVNHKRVERVLRENDLIRVIKRRCATTNSVHGYRRYPNLVRHLEVTRPDQVWCADITYVQLPRGFAYLAILLDLFTRGLRGWHLGHLLNTDLALTALQKALRQGKPEIHHSDQGVQYAADGYTAALEQRGVRVSMAAVGQPTQNPYAERVIRTIKEEEVYLADYESFADAYQRIGHFIEDVYRTKRIHSALGYLTPAEFEANYWDAVQDTP